ncbi:BQ2448_2702 [Microbotryum intermedium]|uniref:BQ2448_2702 protein n=1 Tax=Microbotryum intermedium TaxID=269621 RepID=A0A238FGU2_9BASI|nr:BQ2448_2702 [Microbotryum intermedium]
MLLCVACSATVDDSTYEGPLHSEKVLAPHHFVECAHAVCGACVAQRRSLARACILCETTHDVLTGAAAGNSSGGALAHHRRTHSMNPTTSTLHKPMTDDRAPPSYDEQGNGFILGDDEAERDSSSPPPPIDDDSAYFPPSYHQVAQVIGDDAISNATSANGKQHHEKEAQQPREQCSMHYLKPDDTLLGLALHYKVDPPSLAKMNKLPISTLSTTPHLLHTLPFLLLPPSVTSSSSSAPILPPAEERRRLIIRRFQMHTRCSDWALAKVYVDQVYQRRAQELEMINSNRRARGEIELEDDDTLIRGGELEQAIKAWKKDEAWEKSQLEAAAKGKGKGKEGVTMGSRLKSTGQVEAKVKGWSWPR